LASLPNIRHEKDCRGTSRNTWQAIGKGIRGICPACGAGRMFRAYLKVNDICPHCGEELYHHRADDAPPYLTILVVGHIVGSLMLLTETYWPDAPIWLHAMIWPTLALILSLWFLPILSRSLKVVSLPINGPCACTGSMAGRRHLTKTQPPHPRAQDFKIVARII
jgi:uncharacterized protein (DUF983 family)